MPRPTPTHPPARGAPVTVTILSNSELRAEGLERMLNSTGFVVRSHLHDHTGTVPAESTADDDVFILDAAADEQGIATITNLRHLHPSARIALLCDHCGRDELRLAFMAGADSVLLWNSKPPALVSMLRLVATGERLAPSPLVRKLLETFGSREGQAAGTRQSPSEREQAILRCLADGCSNKEIASRLGIGVATVRLHVRTLLRKLGSMNRTQAAIWAISNGFGSPTS